MNKRIQLRRNLLAIAAAACMATIGSAQAAGEEQAASGVSAVVHSGAGAGLNVEQRLREELRVVVMDLIQSGAFGNTSPQQITLNVEAPPQKVSNLGLIVDRASAGEGLQVLAVTPGGSAERMGLRAGDVLLALNDKPLAAADGAATLRQTVDTLPDNGQLSFNVRRDGRTQTLSGASASMYLPAMHLSIGQGAQLAANNAAPDQASYPAIPVNDAEGCGRISDFDVAPRQQDLHAATIIAIDGITPGPFGARAFQVGAGTHVLKIGERIKSKYISFDDRMRNGMTASKYKMLTINVEPNTTYFVAARLNEAERNNPVNGAYWDPVMWKSVAEGCR
ncbi:MAG: PDZ domain-containing protein [Rhodanobacteraceae bacterium]